MTTSTESGRAREATPKLPGWLQVLVVFAAVHSMISPLIWMSRIQSFWRLRIWRLIHHLPGSPSWTTFRLELLGFKTISVHWYDMHDSAKGVRDTLKRLGVATWVWAISPDGTWSFKVRKGQSHWAEYILLRAGTTPCTLLEPETIDSLPRLNELARRGEGPPKPWGRGKVTSKTWDEFARDNFLVPLEGLPALLELPFALARLVEFKTQHVHHRRGTQPTLQGILSLAQFRAPTGGQGLGRIRNLRSRLRGVLR